MATVLLVIDMQTFFTSMTSTCLPNILRLIDYFHSRSRPIIFTQHGHTDAELTPPFKNQLVKRWGVEGSIRIGTSDWDLMPSIASAQKKTSGVVLKGKNTYDSFINTNLASLLEDFGAERVVVTGVMTDCCCDTTGRSAFNRGYDAWMVNDATGSADEKQHEAGLQAFGYAFGPVVSTAEVMKRLC